MAARFKRSHSYKTFCLNYVSDIIRAESAPLRPAVVSLPRLLSTQAPLCRTLPEFQWSHGDTSLAIHIAGEGSQGKVSIYRIFVGPYSLAWPPMELAIVLRAPASWDMTSRAGQLRDVVLNTINATVIAE